jgi:Ca2+-binding EF-hand superfamily protein
LSPEIFFLATPPPLFFNHLFIGRGRKGNGHILDITSKLINITTNMSRGDLWLDPKAAQEWVRWSSIFDQWDSDGNGYVCMDELKQGISYFLDTSGTFVTMFEVRGILVDMSVSDKGMDRQVFGSFMRTLAQTIGVPLEVLATSLADQRDKATDLSSPAAAEALDRRINNDEAWNRIPELFRKMDTDKDGFISRHEMSVAVRKVRSAIPMRITLADILAMMDSSDVDGNCRLDLMEFGAWLGRFSLACGVPLQELVEQFLAESSDHEDTAQDATASKRSLRKEEGMAKGWQQMPLLFDVMDRDNSGTIDRAELASSMARLIQDNGLKFSVQECHDIFSDVDLNRDNVLDRREFGCFLSRFSAEADITLDEVTYYLQKQSEEQAEPSQERTSMDVNALETGWSNMPKLFAMWDKDGDGLLNREEIAMGINQWRNTHRDECKISLAECLMLMDEVDVDGNRALDKMEFGAFLARFSLATGVQLDKLVAFFLSQYREDAAETHARRVAAVAGGQLNRQASNGRQAKPRGQSFFGSLMARASISLAEESVETVAETQTRSGSKSNIYR